MSFLLSCFVYLDGLLQKLAASGVGCHWGNLFAGSVWYADDIVLLAPSALLQTLPSWLNGATLFPLPLRVSQTAVCLLVPHRRRELVGDMLIGNSTLSCMEWMSAPLAYPERAGWSQTLAMGCLFYLHSIAQYNPNL